jgi:DNA polymerase
MDGIAGEVRVCVKCPLWRGRGNAVPGEGNIEANIVFVGEAPGRWEDSKGLPFVGAAGKILDTLLEKIGLPRENVFITNVVKCRPPRNREPHPQEIATCTGLYLNRQVTLIQPKIIVTLGRHSTTHILSEAGYEKVESITSLRGRVYDVKFLNLDISVFPTYHPASVLHNPRYRDELENDFQILKTELQKRQFI